MTDRSFAESRFGLGLRGDVASDATSDPRGWAAAQIGRFEAKIAGIPTRAEVAADLGEFYAIRREARMEQRAAAATSPTMTDMPMRDPEVRAARRAARDAYPQLVGARLQSALTTPTPFLERMTHFWSNHFAVSAQKLTVVGFAGLLEMEAIRPNVTGTFGDILLAVERHPAMLFYLDQAQSIGPDSVVGARAAARGNKRGLNENLAREILELHTLGVRTGYAQADVTEFARALTGWTVAGVGRGAGARIAQGSPGDFVFAAQLHQPGARTIMGRHYAEGGEEQARSVLSALAVHPATARHIATKLARHFAADNPPAAMVARIEAAFLKSGGDLPTVYRALIDSPEAWDATSTKFRSPWDWTVAALRATRFVELPPEAAVALLRELGQPAWQPPSPAGWGDDAASWAGPDALVRRVETAQHIAQRAGEGVDARALAPKVLGSRLSARTNSAIARAESPETGLALLLASPEMLRR
ncbi:DUF1800 domain-containing protein [Sphingomonas sp. LY29]|uniref:DUF1800 domain-containing protein n=1 Tax=Sphingomonas sp. LY29 TaxID=3095341 RepID=UPI002D7A1810|nr:DUF1800 domain-containing protein [Sphingomonas sp. LY29]WRP25405.1 DUF1800 domain-containing protein [Sphingomonas sp. LY29]